MSLPEKLNQPLSRRLLLSGSAAVAAGPLLVHPSEAYARTTAPLPAEVFTLGVASGDPLPDGVVLWTRLAPVAGMPARSFGVEWEIALDGRFARGRRSGLSPAHPPLGHSVHVDVRGLRPDTVHYYRFRVSGQISPIGRTRTAPTAAVRTAATFTVEAGRPGIADVAGAA